MIYQDRLGSGQTQGNLSEPLLGTSCCDSPGLKSGRARIEVKLSTQETQAQHGVLAVAERATRTAVHMGGAGYSF
jgi:hypothetical protein